MFLLSLLPPLSFPLFNHIGIEDEGNSKVMTYPPGHAQYTLSQQVGPQQVGFGSLGFT